METKPRLVIPIFSMRSYKTGKYSILKDGNFKLAVNRLKPGDIIVVPENSSDFAEFCDLGLVEPHRILLGQYGLSALETREVFWKRNDFDLGFDIITDITDYNGKETFYNNFNITKDPKIPRSYIDRFWEQDIDSIRRAEHTTVLNHSQKDYIIQEFPELEDKVSVNQKVISKNYFDKVGTSKMDIDIEFFKNSIFFPFRLSDPCYKWNEVLEFCKNNDLSVFITDPNESYKGNDDCVITIKPNKKEYYYLLSLKPTIIYNENPDLVFHPGLADFIYFGCEMINLYTLPSLEDILI